MSSYSKGGKELLEANNTTALKPSSVNFNEIYKEAKKMTENVDSSPSTMKSEFLKMVEKEKYQAIEVDLSRDIFYETNGEEEYIKSFEVFEHYLAIIVSKMPEQKD